MMYGRDKSAPTPTVCLLNIIHYRFCGVEYVFLMIVRARWICPYAYGMFADIMQWINLVVCLLDYEWLSGEMNLPLRIRCVRCYTFMHWINLVVCLLDYEWLSGEMNLPLRCVADIMHWINLVVCLLDYEWLSGEMNQPLRLRDVRCYIFMQWIDHVECPLIYILSNE